MILKHKLKLVENRNYSYAEYTCVNPYKAKKDPDNRVIFLKVNDYINTCGKVIKTVIEKDFSSKTSKFKIVCDDLETEIGQVKNSLIGKDRGHNGIKSVVNAFGTNDFEKIKIGIGRPNSKDPNIVAGYVLSKFSPSQTDVLHNKSFLKIEDYINKKC